MKIDHVALWTDDLEKEKDFFTKYFKCRAGEKYLNPIRHFSSYFLQFSDGMRIELMNQEGTIPGKAENVHGLAHIAFDVGTAELVDRMTDQLEKDGMVIAGRPRVTGDGYYESVILDPEGNRIELISILK
jgi:lactoylglutathione lyase